MKVLLELPEELSYCKVASYLGEGYPEGATNIDVFGFRSTKISMEFPNKSAAQRVGVVMEQMGVAVSYLTQ